MRMGLIGMKWVMVWFIVKLVMGSGGVGVASQWVGMVFMGCVVM